MTRSRFDPLDMALGALAADPTAPPEPTATTPADPPASSNPRNASNARNHLKAKGSLTRAAATTAAAKTQLNVYLPVTAADELRQAVIDLGQRYSLGDLVARLIDADLPRLVDELSAEGASTQLRRGRKVRPAGE